ncbi:MAG: YdjY domain-containing protein, partial [Phycisphaeraceae bacterium]
HTALLLIGAQNGHPAMVKPANEEKTAWHHLPPRGDRVALSLLIPDPEDEAKRIERPISDFIRRSEHAAEAEGGVSDDEAREAIAEAFDGFLFTGSQIAEADDGRRLYLADESGHVVSISTFGDEVLGLPSRVSQDNNALAWSADPTHLPKVGTEVTLRLTLQPPPDAPDKFDEDDAD